MRRDIYQFGNQGAMHGTYPFAPPSTNLIRCAGRPDIESDWGPVVIRDCSLVGVSCVVDISNYSSSDTIECGVYKTSNFATNTGLWSVTSPSVTGNGIVTWSDTQASGVDTLSAGDALLVTLYPSGNSDVFEYLPIVFIELEYDDV